MKKRALISVSDKTGLADFAKGLQAAGWEIVATGGTQKLLEASGIGTVGISEVTGFPEICGGRVKTLHPKVHGALLARRDDPSHVQALKDNGIKFIDLVCVNLYPFRETVAKPGVTMEDAVEHIDIGGPSMLRSAAKNWRDVTVVCDPADYSRVLAEIREHGDTLPETRLQLSAKAYTHTAEYDICIADFMREQAGLPEKLFAVYDLRQTLRYGENPHQSAKFYANGERVPFSLADAVQLNGKELSYNNIQDANAALNLVREFEAPFCTAVKHTNPCGAGIADTVEAAWRKAYEGDPVSIFGGIVAVNRPVTRELAAALKPIFLEIVIAPDYEPEALDLLRTKKNLRVLKVDMDRRPVTARQCISVNGGLLVQDQDFANETLTPEMCVTETRPSAAQMADLQFGWTLAKHVKSNSIVVVRDGQALGVGAGQMNRVGSAEIALRQAHSAGHKEGLVLASDGFFPFGDTVALAARYGVAAIVQPGGSVRDQESVDNANQAGIAMLCTGVRHFKH